MSEVHIYLPTPTVLTEVIRGFPQFTELNVEIVPFFLFFYVLIRDSVVK